MNISPINMMPKYENKILRNAQTPVSQINTENSDVAFKGKEGPITRFFANTYGKAMLNSDFVNWLSKSIANADKKGNASRHFQVVGSFVTSGAYMKATLSNPEFDKKNAVTLAINQALGFLVPTVAAYTIDSAMGNFNKAIEYKYSAIQEKKLAPVIKDIESKIAKLGAGAEKEIEALNKQKANELAKLSKRLRGCRTGMSIIVFTTVYRYLAPVLITPVANKAGNWFNSWLEKRREAKVAKEESQVALA